MCFSRLSVTLLIFMLLAGCGDNLAPSGADQRPTVQTGTTGAAPGQNAPDFSVTATDGRTVTLASALASRRAVVLYFTMWCPVCDEQTTQMQAMRPSFPGVDFYLVDYVSGSVADAGASALANGFTGVGLTTLADTGRLVMNSFQGTMETTVVVNAAGVVLMNEGFRDGSRLQAVLNGLPAPAN